MPLASQLKHAFPFYYGWVVVGASGTTVFARMAPAITTLTVLIYPMSQELGWSRTMISGSVSAGALLALALSPVIGWAIDRYGARPVLVISVLGLGAAITSLAWATIPVTFYAAFAAARVVFHNSAPIGATTVVSRWFIRKRGKAIGVIFVFGSVGGVLFTMVASLMVDAYGLKATWITIGVIVLLSSVAPSLFLIAERPEDVGLLPDGDTATDNVARHLETRHLETRPVEAAAEPTDRRDDESWSVVETTRTGAFWILVFLGFAMFFVHTGVGVHMGAYFRDVGLSPTSAALAVSLMWLVSGIGSIVWGWVLDKMESRLAYSGVLLFQAGGALFLIFVTGTGTAYIAAVLIGVVSAGSNVVPAVMYANFFGRRSLGSIRGFGEMGVLIGQSTGPVLAGLLFDLQGTYSLIFGIYTAMALGCSVLVLKAKAPVKRQVALIG